MLAFVVRGISDRAMNVSGEDVKTRSSKYHQNLKFLWKQPPFHLHRPAIYNDFRQVEHNQHTLDHTVEPLLSGHPLGTGKLLLNRGSSEMSIIHNINVTSSDYNTVGGL